MRAGKKQGIKDAMARFLDSDLSDFAFISAVSKEVHLPEWVVIDCVSRDPEFFGWKEGVDDAERGHH